jgi:hypothetical protein
MALIDELLGCPLLEITRSYWAVKLDRKIGPTEWVCQKRTVHDFRRGDVRQIDWMDDIVATGDSKHIVEIWLLCPPSRTSPPGNTARLPVTTPGTAFQFNIGTADSAIVGRATQTHQAQIIGRVENGDGDCLCFAWDYVEDGLWTPESTVYDPHTQHIKTNEDGTPFYPMRQYNVNNFGRIYSQAQHRWIDAMWRSSLAPPGRLAIDRLGVTL